MPRLQNNQSKMDWKCGSSSREPALQTWSPEFEPQVHKNNNNEKEKQKQKDRVHPCGKYFPLWAHFVLRGVIFLRILSQDKCLPLRYPCSVLRAHYLLNDAASSKENSACVLFIKPFINSVHLWIPACCFPCLIFPDLSRLSTRSWGQMCVRIQNFPNKKMQRK
jgi:hypothetical protein